MGTEPLRVVDLGLRAYREVLDLQRDLCRARLDRRFDEDLLLLVEHPPVITLGRGTKPTSLPFPVAILEARGYQVVEVERGGDVTVHAPGQLVAYPILDLSRHRQDLHWYLRQLEEVLIRTLARFEIPGERNPGYTGVWTRSRKIASIGIHVKQWITFHGLALNVTTDLRLFDLVVPCGIPNVTMTSVVRELPGAAPADLGPAVRTELIREFEAGFDRIATPAELPIELSGNRGAPPDVLR